MKNDLNLFIEENIFPENLRSRFFTIFSKDSIHLQKRVFYSKNISDYLAIIAKVIILNEKSIFLGNPTWISKQQKRAEIIAQHFFEKHPEDKGKIFIATGGSGGEIRFVAHTKKTLKEAVFAFQKEIEVLKINSFICLPTWHISGIMPFFRSFWTKGKVYIEENRSFDKTYIFPKFRLNTSEFWMISLVGTQLFRLQNSDPGVTSLRMFNFVLLGASRISRDIIKILKTKKVVFGVGYGMTETAALVALAKNNSDLGHIFSHTKIRIGKDKGIYLSCSSLGRTLLEDGTFLRRTKYFKTGDEGFLDENGFLHILGRLNRYINSGGEKIDPRLVEATLLKNKDIKEVLVVAKENQEWGEIVVALIILKKLDNDIDIVQKNLKDQIIQKLRKNISAYMCPKEIIFLKTLPFDAKGKIDKICLAKILN